MSITEDTDSYVASTSSTSVTIFKSMDTNGDPDKLLVMFRGDKVARRPARSDLNPHSTKASAARPTSLSGLVNRTSQVSASASSSPGISTEPEPAVSMHTKPKQVSWDKSNLHNILNFSPSPEAVAPRKSTTTGKLRPAPTLATPTSSDRRNVVPNNFGSAKLPTTPSAPCKDCNRNNLPPLYNVRVYTYHTRCWSCRIAAGAADALAASRVVDRDVARARAQGTLVAEADIVRLKAELDTYFATPHPPAKPVAKRTSRTIKPAPAKPRRKYTKTSPKWSKGPATKIPARTQAQAKDDLAASESQLEPDESLPASKRAHLSRRASTALSTTGHEGLELFTPADRAAIATLRRRQDAEMRDALQRAQLHADIREAERTIAGLKRKLGDLA